MPTYEYACDQCGHRFETFQSIKAEPLTECPSCEDNSLRRMIGLGAGIIFKGSGFYQTDYRKDNGRNGGETSPGEPAKQDSGKQSRSESASTTKQESGTAPAGSKD